MALDDTKLIYNDNPGGLPASYTVPDGSDITIQSIVARIDGSAAAGSFLPTLTILSSSGQIIARVPSDITYAPGDTGVVTWSPFLRKSVSAAPPPVSTGLPWATLFTGVQTDNPAGGSPIFANLSAATLHTNSSLLTKANSGAGFWGIAVLGPVLIRATAWLEHWDVGPPFANGAHDVGVTTAQAITDYGPAPEGTQMQRVTGDWSNTTTFPPSLVTVPALWAQSHIAYTSAVTPLVVGASHEFSGWNNGAFDFKYGVMVEIIGAKPN